MHNNTLLVTALSVATTATGVLMTVASAASDGEKETQEGVYNAGDRKQLFMDNTLIESLQRLKIVVNRPTMTGEKTIFREKPWEEAEVHPFGVAVVQDEEVCRMYYPSISADGRLWYCCATSRDGVRWTKPDLDIVPFGAIVRTNILMPNEHTPESLSRGAAFFGTCVIKDTNPRCLPHERYKLINSDVPTWVFASPDGLHFKPMFGKPSHPAADTNNVFFYDDRIGKYVAYMRQWSPLDVVGRCEFADLTDFGSDTVVFAADDEDQRNLDRSRFAIMDFYNSSATKYPHAANAYLMFPSAFHRFKVPPEGAKGSGVGQCLFEVKSSEGNPIKVSNDGVLDIQLATSSDGVRWTRFDRNAVIPLAQGQAELFMASGMVRQGGKLYLYYGVYHQTHGEGLDARNYITRAELRLDGFVSVDANAEEGRLTTVPMTFSCRYLELNLQGKQARVGLLDEQDRPIRGFSLTSCDPISGDHIARRVSWKGRSDLSKLAGRTVKLAFSLKNTKLYAFQFASG